MKRSLLTTQLNVPQHPQGLVRRALLCDALDQAARDHRLVLVSAPAGYGKTTLLADWARSSRTSAGWLSLSRDEDDLERFLRYLLLAWQQVWPDITDTPLAVLLGSASPDPHIALSAFLNAAAELTSHQVLILDDYHLLQDPSIHDGMSFLVDHLPPQLHFVLGTRADPPLPLSRYRAHGQLVEIRTPDLRFTLPEAKQFLVDGMGLDLKDEEIHSLNDRLEGWPAGLQLAALRLRVAAAGSSGGLSFSGRERFVADYLKEDVFEHLSQDVQGFLLHTSILERMCGPLCDAVTGVPDGQVMLDRLERENLFVHCLDDERRWFRYHLVFAEYLSVELAARMPAEIPELHRRAALWYDTNGLPEQAFGHAVQGGDVERVVAICERHGPEKISRGEFTIVRRWVESLPEQWYADHPALAIVRASLLGVTGAFEAFARQLDDLELRLVGVETNEARRLRARATALRCAAACMRNNLTQAEEFGGRAARELAQDDLFFRELIHLALGDTYRQAGRWQEARDSYLEALHLNQSSPYSQNVHALGALADLGLRQGRLDEAAGLWEKALQIVEAKDGLGELPLPVVGWVFVRRAEIAYERDERQRARDLLHRGLERAELGGDVRGMIAGYLLAGRIALTEGDAESAASNLERARPLVDQSQFSEWRSRFERFQLELWLAQGRLRAAVQWCDQIQQDGLLESRTESEVTQLAVARVLIVKGDPTSLDRARTIVGRLLDTADAEGRTGVAIEALALQALAAARLGDLPAALTSLERSLRAAEGEGYVRLFADLGLRMGRLLQEARSRSVMTTYVERLLAAFGPTLPASASVLDRLPEPLTPREQEILRLIAAGLTNREIAVRLVVSAETVKKHTANIFGKLHVRNRTQAVDRGRELDLLS